MSINKLNHQTIEPQGRAMGDMAILYPATKTRKLCAQALEQPKLPVASRLGSWYFATAATRSR